ncbi:MAG: hypothetical protein HYR95_02385 [Candidatus Colwellbacteria bacterium]|nr:hypothetical protein [Candidatus Colwellbacteria bacterium]
MSYQSGFTPIVVALIIIVMVAVGVGGYTAFIKNGQGPAPETPESISTPITSVRPAQPSSETSETETTSQKTTPLPSSPQSPSVITESPRLSPTSPKIETQTPSMLNPPNTVFQELEREISTIADDNRPIGPEHYARLKSELNAAQTVGTNQKRVQELQTMLETVNPNNIVSTASPAPAPSPSPSSGPSATTTPNCISNPSPTFTNHITDTSKVSYVAPPPTMGSGPSLKTHSYIGTNGANVPVYAPAAMTLKAGSHSVGGPYTFEFQISCEVTVRFGHVTNPVDTIKTLLPSEPQSGSQTQELSPISFAAGELIAYTTGTAIASNWDFGVYNSAVSNRYASDPNWNNSTTYTTAVCPFDYFSPFLKSAYTAKFNSAILGGNPPHGVSFCGT